MFPTKNQNRAADILQRISYRVEQWFPQAMAQVIIEEFGAALDAVAVENAHVAAQIACGVDPECPGRSDTAQAIFEDIVRASGVSVAGVAKVGA